MPLLVYCPYRLLEASGVIPVRSTPGLLRVLFCTTLAIHCLVAGVKRMVERLDRDAVLALSCGAVAVGAIKSMIEHSIEGMGCFRREQFWERMVIRYHSGTLMYTNP